MIGKTLGHYQITQKLGQGGMGIVYKARDTHLDRFVAIKVLPAEKVADPDRKRRFVQEAKAASALNHPNIIYVYDIDQSEGIDYIAMEYVDGKTLDQRIGHRGLRLNDALKYAVQIADALAKAHSAGIVHRDLKPTNIIVNEDGVVKVLDFGLAKLTECVQGDETASTATIDDEGRPITEEGVIVGTVSYMSPEQAEGKKVDARSDIFSLGSVLYEMVTGQKAFQGTSKMSTLSAILHQEPKPVSGITPAIPPDLEKLINRCLRKDQERRIQHMDDVKLALLELKEDSDSGRLKATPSGTRHFMPVRFVIGAVAVVVLVAAGWYWFGRRRAPEPEAVLTAIPLTSYPGYEDSPSFSPDGKQVAFEWCREGWLLSCGICIKQIGVEQSPFPLTADRADDFSPAWSPDGDYIAFLRVLPSRKAELRIIPQRGGQAKMLVEVDVDRWRELDLSGPYAAWTPDSKWLALPSAEPHKTPLGLLLVSVKTTEKRRLTTSPAGFFDCTPAFSPDGRTLAFTRCSNDRSGICFLRLSENYEPQGEPQRATASEEQFGFGPAWTQDGRDIVYCGGLGPASSAASKGLWRMAARTSGKPTRLVFATDAVSPPAASREENRLAYAIKRTDVNIYRIDLGEPGRHPGIPYKFISSTRNEVLPTFSPDGKRIAFTSDRSGFWEVWVCDADGSNAVSLTSLRGEDADGSEWSPDGRSIAFGSVVGGERYVCVAGIHGGAPRRLVTVPAINWAWPSWSRDGQSIYFRSKRSGSSAIWKVPAAGGDAVQITPDGVERDIPRESPDGKFLYFRKLDGVWRIPTGGGQETKVVDSGGYVQIFGQHGIYFLTPADKLGRRYLSFYDSLTGKERKMLTIENPRTDFFRVSPDGRTVLYNKADEAGRDLTLVENFR